MDKCDLIPIMNALITANLDGTFINIKNTIYYDNTPLKANKNYNEEDFQERLKVFSKILNIEDVVSEHLYYTWKTEFDRNTDVTKRDLLLLAKKATLRKDLASSVLEKYANALQMKFLHIGVSTALKDKFNKNTSKEDREKYMELYPIFYDMPNKLLNDKKWKYVDTPFENMKPLELDDAWVDLEFIEPWINDIELSDKETHSKFKNIRTQNFSLREPIDLILEAFHGFMIIVGVPGSGKTTLLKWIAKSLIKNPDGKFILPFFIPLREYVVTKSKYNNETILDFALRYIGITDENQKDKWINSISYLTGTKKDNVLLLLDGWDEVPLDKREILKQEIEELSYGFSIILTSRHSGYPRTFTADTFYEIGNLSDTQIDRLVINYFRSNTNHAQKLLNHIQQHQDLYDMGRNPFLLTLLCGIFLYENDSDTYSLPSTRTEIYNKSINYIYNQHNQRYPSHLFNSNIKIKIKKLAYKIFNDKIPRYFFDDNDVSEVFSDKKQFDEIVKISRLLSQIRVDKSIYQFLHATFQEFFIAKYLNAEDDRLEEFLNKYLRCDSVIEIMSFLAGMNKKNIFWDKVDELIKVPDRYGFIYIKVVKLLIETNKKDLIDKIKIILWKYILKSPYPKIYIESLAKLDISFLNKKLEELPNDVSQEKHINIKRVLLGIRNGESSKILLKDILHGREEEASVASNAIKHNMSLEVRKILYERLTKDYNFQVFKYVILALARTKDENCIKAIMTLFYKEELKETIIKALSEIGSNVAIDKLFEIFFDKKNTNFQKVILDNISYTRTLYARDKIIEILVRCDTNNDIIEDILYALDGLPISSGSSIILSFLTEEFSEKVQKKAIGILRESSQQGITDRLREIAKNSNSTELKKEALEALEKRCCDIDMHWLETIIRNTELEEELRVLSLNAIIDFTMRMYYRNQLIDITNLILFVLNENSNDMTYSVATQYFIKDEKVITKITSIFQDKETSPNKKEILCNYFVKLKIKSIISVLRDTVTKYPDVQSDEVFTQTNDAFRFAIICASALCKIDIREALKINGDTMNNALFLHSLENGLLVYDNVIYDSNGKDILIKA